MNDTYPAGIEYRVVGAGGYTAAPWDRSVQRRGPALALRSTTEQAMADMAVGYLNDVMRWQDATDSVGRLHAKHAREGFRRCFIWLAQRDPDPFFQRLAKDYSHDF